MRYPTVSNNNGDHRSHFGDGNECYVHKRSRWRPLLALGGGLGRPPSRLRTDIGVVNPTPC